MGEIFERKGKKVDINALSEGQQELLAIGLTMDEVGKSSKVIIRSLEGVHKAYQDSDAEISEGQAFKMFHDELNEKLDPRLVKYYAAKYCQNLLNQFAQAQEEANNNN